MKDEFKKRKKDDEEFQNSKSKKADGSSGSSCKSNKLAHYPMSERQQYALLRQMDDDNNSTAGVMRETSETSSNISGHSNDSSSYVSTSTVDRPGAVGGGVGVGSGRLHRRNGTGETPLIQMAKKGDLAAIRSLLAEGANVNERDYAGWTALHESSIRNYPQIATCLLAADADVNASGLHGDTALHDAVRNSCTEVVRLLVRAGADPRRRNDKGIRPLDLAQTDEVRKALLASGNSSSSGPSTTSAASAIAEHSTPSKDKRLKHNRDSGSASSDQINKQELAKDPYAFEDEEASEKHDQCKITPGKAAKTSKQSQWDDSKESSKSQSTPTITATAQSPQTVLPGGRESRSNSPKVPPLRIKIASQTPSGPETTAPEEDQHQQQLQHTTQHSSDSECSSGGRSIDTVAATKSASDPTLGVVLAVVVNVEPEEESCGMQNLIKQEPVKGEPVAVEQVIKTELKEEPQVGSNSGGGKRTSGRTLRSHTQAATQRDHHHHHDKHSANQQHGDKAPIKKRRFKRGSDLGPQTDKTGVKTEDQRHHGNSGDNEEYYDEGDHHDQHLENDGEDGPETDQHHQGGQMEPDDQDELGFLTDRIQMTSTSSPSQAVIGGAVTSSSGLGAGVGSSAAGTQEFWHNPYRRALRLQRRLDCMLGHEMVHPKSPVGYPDFLLATGSYLLAGQAASPAVSRRPVPADIKRRELAALFEQQETARHQQALKHQAEREHLRITAEQQIIRAHSQAARQLAGQDKPYSFCSVVAFKNYTYVPDSRSSFERSCGAGNGAGSSSGNSSKKLSLHDPEKANRLSSEDFFKLLNTVKIKYETETRHMLNRQLHESESLMMVQSSEWQLKLRDLQLEDIHGDPSLTRMSLEHVPMVQVPPQTQHTQTHHQTPAQDSALIFPACSSSVVPGHSDFTSPYTLLPATTLSH